MEGNGDTALTPSHHLLETLTRTLRHEVGDLLQTIYSTVAILQERLPPDQKLERRLLTDLKGRGENCKNELDAVVDLICPLNLSRSPLDLAEVLHGLTNVFATRYPNLKLLFEHSGKVPVLGDARRLAQVGHLLLQSACQSAQKQVVVRAAPTAGGKEIEWSVSDDGYGATEEQMEWLNKPFPSTHHAQFGLGLALARRVTQLHGGRLDAGNLPEGGFRITLILPAATE
jgi:two-component system NtrC family sensor kinase